MANYGPGELIPEFRQECPREYLYTLYSGGDPQDFILDEGFWGRWRAWCGVRILPGPEPSAEMKCHCYTYRYYHGLRLVGEARELAVARAYAGKDVSLFTEKE